MMNSVNNNARLSILSQACTGNWVLAPYPHLVIENALDAQLFAELEATFPADSLVVDACPVADTWS